jgi:hypothetical protein
MSWIHHRNVRKKKIKPHNAMAIISMPGPGPAVGDWDVMPVMWGYNEGTGIIITGLVRTQRRLGSYHSTTAWDAGYPPRDSVNTGTRSGAKGTEGSLRLDIRRTIEFPCHLGQVAKVLALIPSFFIC